MTLVVKEKVKEDKQECLAQASVLHEELSVQLMLVGPNAWPEQSQFN